VFDAIPPNGAEAAVSMIVDDLVLVVIPSLFSSDSASCTVAVTSATSTTCIARLAELNLSLNVALSDAVEALDILSLTAVMVCESGTSIVYEISIVPAKRRCVSAKRRTILNVTVTRLGSTPAASAIVCSEAALASALATKASGSDTSIVITPTTLLDRWVEDVVSLAVGSAVALPS